MIKVGILGGSFDPIHKGHIAIIKEAKSQLNLDRFMVIPTKNNPWKKESYTTVEQRFAMISIALRNLENTEINDIEMHSLATKKNYTIDTLCTLRKRYPDFKFYYIMGMDQASQFNKWKNAKEISEIVQLVAFGRIGYQANENIKAYNFIKLNHFANDISSTDIRNGEIQYLDPKVLEYMVINGLYLETIIKSKMSNKRYLHTISMAKLASEIASSNDVDVNKAYVAGMLHDIAKEMPEKEARKIMEEHFPMYLNKPLPIWHQWISAYIAKTIYQVHDSEILQAIRHHTTAATKMSKLDMCIYVADKYDPSRAYDSSKEIALCKKDVVAGFKQCLQDFYEYSKKENRKIDVCFYEVYDRYIKEK